jgi:hypothetical protein
MKRALLLLLASMIYGAASADIVKMETNDWSNPRTLIWSGTLQRIDPSTQIAYFSFRNKSSIEEFAVHITRIYSLTLDSQTRVDRSFPTTRQSLIEPLPSSPRSTEILELTSENFIGDELPAEVRVRPDRSSPTIYLSGTIKQADLQNMVLEAKAANRSRMEFEISRADLMKWIRGR